MNGFTLLCWAAGLAVVWASWRVAVWIHEAPTISEDDPQGLSALDRLERDGLEAFSRERGAR